MAIAKLSMPATSIIFSQPGIGVSPPDPAAAAAAPAADPVAMLVGVSAPGLKSLTWLEVMLSMSQNAMCNMCLYACSLFNLSV